MKIKKIDYYIMILNEFRLGKKIERVFKGEIEVVKTEDALLLYLWGGHELRVKQVQKYEVES